VHPTITLLSVLGETLQTLGVMAITLLFMMLYRVLLRTYFLRWGQAWLAMLAALISLHLVFSYPWLRFLEPLYFAGEYVFAALLWLGFTSFPERNFPVQAYALRLFLVIAAWSLFLTLFDSDFSNRFTLHALAFTVSLIPAWIALSRLVLPAGHRWAKKTALIALSLLMLNFILCASPLFYSPWAAGIIADCYFAYQSIFDLMFEMFLAFSLLIIAAVNMKGELELANHLLANERDNMSMLAHQDALTGCFNRHALRELQARLRDRRGLVAMIDINNLKPINDLCGHNVGDQAICRVAQALKARMRSQDYLFRYGGDEFVIISFEMHQAEAEQRLQDIQHSLKHLPPLAGLPNAITIAWGIQAFSDGHSFDRAINAADSLMYQQKQAFHQVSPR
jgi:diguanylate cyclase (GGDEF)-like protein